MEHDKALLTELVGKKVLIKTHYGIGTRDDMALGDYKGLLLAFDEDFLKIEYDIKKFIQGKSTLSKSVLLINLGYIITIEEYQERPED